MADLGQTAQSVTLEEVAHLGVNVGRVISDVEDRAISNAREKR